MIGYSTIITSAIGSMAGRFITISIYQNDNEKAKSYFNTVFVCNLFLSIIFSIVTIIIVLNISFILNVPEYLKKDVQWLFAFMCLSMLLTLSTSILGIGTFTKNRIDLNSSRTALTNIIRVSLILLLFWLYKPSIIYMSLSAVGANLFYVYYNIKFKKKLLPEININPKKYFSYPALKEMLSSGIWNSINQLSNALLNQLDLLITNIFIGVAITGDYSIAKMVPILILNFLAMLSSTFIPHFNILFAQNKMQELLFEIKKSMQIIGLLISIPIGFLLIYSDCFFKLWVPQENATFLYWLSFITMLPMILGGSINPIFGIFTVTNKLKIPSLVLLIAGLLNTTIIYILLKTTSLGIWAIPLTGAIQSILRNSIFTPVYGALCLKQKWHIFFPTMLKTIFEMLVVIILCLITKQYVEITTWSHFIEIFLLVSILSLIINTFLSLIHISEPTRPY